METKVEKKVELSIRKGDTVNFKTGPAGKKVLTGKIVKYPSNKEISIEYFPKEGKPAEMIVIPKELILEKVAVA